MLGPRVTAILSKSRRTHPGFAGRCSEGPCQVLWERGRARGQPDGQGACRGWAAGWSACESIMDRGQRRMKAGKQLVGRAAPFHGAHCQRTEERHAVRQGLLLHVFGEESLSASVRRSRGQGGKAGSKARSVNGQRGQQRRAEERNTSDGKGVVSYWRRTHPGDAPVSDTGAQGTKCHPPRPPREGRQETR